MIFVCGLVSGCVACTGFSRPSTPACKPGLPAETRSLTIENAGQENLKDYAVGISLDETNFDFTAPPSNGSDLAVSDPATNLPIPHWFESYDPSTEKALLWVKVASLGPQASQKLSLTAGACSASASSGYDVFPFFSDVKDVSSWQATNQLSVTNTIAQNSMTISNRTVIESDGNYNNVPAVARASNGDFVLTYKKGGSHVNSPLVILRRSQDAGVTWSPEVVYFNSSQPDPGLARTPLGDMLIAFIKQDQSGGEGGAYSRSTDNGLTWGPFSFFDNPPTATVVVDPLLNVGPMMYGAGYGLFQGGSGDASSVWSSGDDGFTWSKLSALRQPGEPGVNEIALAQTGPNELFAIMRSDNALDTFGRYSSDMGMSWGPMISYASQVGVLQGPIMIQAGSALILMGRATTAIPGVQPAGTVRYPRQLVAFVSYDGGHTFGSGLVLDTYTGMQIDGGYSWPMLLPNGQVYVVYYADSHNLQKPDIKSLTLTITPPETKPSSSIHVLSQLAPGLATHVLSLDQTRYAVEFRFSSSSTPTGSQFSVVLQGTASGATSHLVNWEFPSTHAADPTADSGMISDGKFVPFLNSFSYGQVYRLRTVVDEAQGTQEPSLLDPFGGLISTLSPQPLAQGVSHATAIQIGNNSSLRATDTMLDFVFVRPVAQTEPTVTVSSGP